MASKHRSLNLFNHTILYIWQKVDRKQISQSWMCKMAGQELMLAQSAGETQRNTEVERER
jgi:hypothetical protein